VVEKFYPTRHTTIGSVIDAGLGILAFCLDCEYAHEVDLDRFARELGREQSVLPVHLVPKLHCPNCGSKRVGTALIQPTTEVPAEHIEHVRMRWRAPDRD
jgi:hypothetical protein